jgi:hypothetical protein
MCQHTWREREGIPYPLHSFSCLCLTFVGIQYMQKDRLVCLLLYSYSMHLVMYAVCVCLKSGAGLVQSFFICRQPMPRIACVKILQINHL